jgi:hypothetical protein
VHTLEAFTEEEAEEENDEAMDRQLGAVNKKLLMLQKEKKRFANQLEAKKKSFGKARETKPGKRTAGKNAKKSMK